MFIIEFYFIIIKYKLKNIKILYIKLLYKINANFIIKFFRNKVIFYYKFLLILIVNGRIKNITDIVI